MALQCYYTKKQRVLSIDKQQITEEGNIDRKAFSRIRCKPDHKPWKTAAFAVAHEPNMPTMLDLLSRERSALSPGSTFARNVYRCITHRNYNLFGINAAPFRYGQPFSGG